MKDILNTLKELRVNNLSRDLYYVASGIFSLLILNFLFKPDINLYPNLSYFSNLERFLSLIIVSYFFSRICNELGILLGAFVKSLLINNKYLRIKNHFKKIKVYINQEPGKIQNTNEITNTELDDFISNNEGMACVHERKIQNIIFSNTLIGFLLILSLTYSLYILIITLFVLIKSLSSEIDLAYEKIEIAKFFWKKQKK